MMKEDLQFASAMVEDEEETHTELAGSGSCRFSSHRHEAPMNISLSDSSPVGPNTIEVACATAVSVKSLPHHHYLTQLVAGRLTTGLTTGLLSFSTIILSRQFRTELLSFSRSSFF